MRTQLIVLLATATALSALAQHDGHGTPPAQQPTQPQAEPDPHAGHDMGTPSSTKKKKPAKPKAPAKKDDPRAGHQMPVQEKTTPSQSDPHAGHGTSPPASDDHGGHGAGAMAGPPGPPNAPPPAEALTGPAHAADTVFDPAVMDAARKKLFAEHGHPRAFSVLADQLEARIRDGHDGYLWDAQAWYGGDIDKVWLKSEGDGVFGEGVEEAELQVLWSHAIAPWWDFQLGARHDFEPDPQRTHLVVGIQGLAPYEFEIDAAAFLSDEGDLTARFEGEFDVLITQRLILQPRLEFDLAAQDVPEIGVGAGLSSIEAGVRLRYEIEREFAPYAGVEYQQLIGDTADFARAAGEDVGGWNVVIGVRSWF
jgi:copper resistance protein B